MNTDTPSKEAVEHYQRSLKFIENEQLQDAVGELKLAIKASPTPFLDAERVLASTYNYWGVVQVKENDVNAALDTFTKAIEQYQKVVTLDPTDTGSWCWLGYIAEALTMGWGEKVQEYAGEMRNSSGSNPIAQLSQVREMGKLQSLRDKYKKVASHALSEAQRRFPLINPAEQPAQMEEAMEAVCTLAELYSQGGSTWLPKSVSWFKLVANVDIDAFPLDFPEQSKNNVIEYKSLAQRRLAVLEDDIARSKKESKNKTTRWLVTFGVVFFSIIAICVCLIILVF